MFIGTFLEVLSSDLERVQNLIAGILWKLQSNANQQQTEYWTVQCVCSCFHLRHHIKSLLFSEVRSSSQHQITECHDSFVQIKFNAVRLMQTKRNYSTTDYCSKNTKIMVFYSLNIAYGNCVIKFNNFI